MSAPAAEVHDLRVQHDDVRALDGISLTVAGGESVALVGPSGAGKTTLLRVLAGTQAPTDGAVALCGVPVATLRRAGALPATVGLLPQRLDLVPQLSVRHNIQAGALGRWGLLRSLAALVLPVEAPVARQAAARVGIEARFHQRVRDCSGGEQQRAALARLLVQDPRILLVDEPVSSLDPARAEQLLGLLRRLSDEDGRTLVASLHHPGLARRHLTRIVALRDGRIVLDAPAAEVTDAMLAGVYALDPGSDPARQTHDRGPR